MEHVWDNSVDSFSNSIRVHISALRKKLRAALGYDPIRNRIGEGYLMGGEGRNEAAFLAVAHHADDRSAHRRHLRGHESAALLLRHVLYGHHCGHLQGGGTVILNDRERRALTRSS